MHPRQGHDQPSRHAGGPRTARILLALCAIAVLDLLLPSGFSVIPLFIVVPALAGPDARVLTVGALTGAATVATGLAGGQGRLAVTAVSLAGVVAATALARHSAHAFTLQARTLADVRAIAETVQRVLLRPIPRRVGALRAEVLYLAAAAEAGVGGDVYDVIDTPFGVRMIIGDVMGNGLDAVDSAADLLGAFRELAQHEEKLSGVADRLDAVFTHRDPESVRFATALLVSVPAGESVAELVCCGHPPPLLLRGTQVDFVQPLHCSPPLGLMDLVKGWCEIDLVDFARGDRLLLYTDGVTEARDGQGGFFPLPERVAALQREEPEALLTALGAEIERHVGGRPRDDAALLLVERGGDVPDPASFEGIVLEWGGHG